VVFVATQMHHIYFRAGIFVIFVLELIVVQLSVNFAMILMAHTLGWTRICGLGMLLGNVEGLIMTDFENHWASLDKSFIAAITETPIRKPITVYIVNPPIPQPESILHTLENQA
jgi:hypothetical protein